MITTPFANGEQELQATAETFFFALIHLFFYYTLIRNPKFVDERLQHLYYLANIGALSTVVPNVYLAMQFGVVSPVAFGLSFFYYCIVSGFPRPNTGLMVFGLCILFSVFFK